jgi:hypothetical protein
MKAEKMPWAPEDIEYVFTHWPTGGWEACREYFVARGRNYHSVRGKANSLKLRVNGRDYVRQATTPAIDARIEREYRSGRPKLKALAREINRTHGWIKWRARELGVARQLTIRPWTPEEDELLRALLEKNYSVTTMHRKFREAGFRRACGGIRNRLDVLDLSWQRDFWTAHETARALRVDSHSVLRWIAAGKLKAKQARGPSVDDLPCLEKKMLYQIKPKDVSQFMKKYPGDWDHRKLPKELLLELLCGGDYGLGEIGG